tara:strand:+ start:55014 stop:55691 length:678 start_codon:yes stop_codon:yes gene_type:complete
MSDTKESTDSDEATTPAPDFSRGIIAAIVVMLFSGIAHGYLDGRWSDNLDLRVHGDRIESLPQECGKWKMTKERDLDDSAADLLRCYGSTLRDYVDSQTGDQITASVLFGPRGPTAIHIPEICFDSIGTQQVGDRKQQTIEVNGKRHTLWSVRFSRDENPEPSIEAWYAWSDGEEWIASNYPRFWMTDTLYKVQISGPVGDKDYSPCRDFLTSFLPQLEELKVRD